MTEADLRRVLDRRLAEYARTTDWHDLEEPAARALDLAGRPLALLGGGSALAQPFVAHALDHCDVRAVVDNGRAGRAGDREFLELARTEPRLLAVMCCSGEGATTHFTALARGAGVPVLSLPQALRRTGTLSWDHGFAFGNPEIVARQLARGLDLFREARSRETFLALLLYRLSWSPHWLDPVRLPERSAYFFTDALNVGGDEVLVDGGAFTGDTVQAFSRRTGGRWRHIHAFEPNPGRLPALRAAVQGLPAVTVHAAGLWSRSAEGVPCVEQAGHAAITPDGADAAGSGRMAVAALDDLDLGLGPVSLIKMDIEGAEPDALEGARRIIAHHKPKLAVCVYHRPGHLARIPTLIQAIRPDYTLRLRHHGPSLFETVLYAV